MMRISAIKSSCWVVSESLKSELAFSLLSVFKWLTEEKIERELIRKNL